MKKITKLSATVSWRTTAGGILSAIGCLLLGFAVIPDWGFVQPWYIRPLAVLGLIMNSLGILFMGMSARDHGVSTERACGVSIDTKTLLLIPILFWLCAGQVQAQYSGTNLTGITVTKPLDGDAVSQGAGAIREIKRGTVNSFQQEHVLDGRHIRFYGVDVGTVNAIQINVPISTTVYEPGMMFGFRATNINTGPVTLTVVNSNSVSLGAKSILVYGSPATTGAIQTNQIYETVYDGTQFHLINPGTNVTFSSFSAGAVVGGVYVESATATNITSAEYYFPQNDTIPAITNGYQFVITNYTPRLATSKLKVTAVVNAFTSNDKGSLAVFTNSVTNAIASCYLVSGGGGANSTGPTVLQRVVAAGVTNAITFQGRIGIVGGSLTLNSDNSGRLYGGTMVSSMTIEELQQ